MLSQRSEAAVTATFDDGDRAVQALESLWERSVPPRSIDVAVVADESGEARTVRVHSDMTALRGLWTGALAGAVVALPLAVLMSLGTLGLELGFLSADVAIAAAQGAALGAALGGPIGVLRSLISWNARLNVPSEALRRGRVVLTVTSDALAHRARLVLQDAEPEQLTVHGATPTPKRTPDS